MSIKVRATKAGYIGMGTKKEGDVFELVDIQTKDAKGKPKVITAEQQFSENWMERVTKNTRDDDSEEEEERRKQVERKGARASDHSKI